ncbi:MAG: hypothetical protein AAF773_04920 [Cyanobacteria bacterium P01_D01_bin.115]
MTRTKSWVIKSGIFVLIMSCITAMQISRLRSALTPQDSTLPQQAELQTQEAQLQLSLLKTLPDLGFRNLVADWTFLNFLQYFGSNEYRQINGYGLSADYFDVILERDPYFYLAYVYLSSSVSIFAGQAEKAVELQERGLQYLSPEFPPEGYFIWRHKGIDEVLFLDDAEAASRSHQIAAEWAAQSSDRRAQEDQISLQRTAEFLASNPDKTQAQIGAWSQVLGSVPDEKTQAEVIKNIEALGYEVVPNEQGSYSIKPQASTAEE